jgi:hypothetical protein
VLAVISLAACDGSHTKVTDGRVAQDAARDGRRLDGPGGVGDPVLHVPFATLTGQGANCTPDTSGQGHVVSCDVGGGTIALDPTAPGSGSESVSIAGSAYLETDSSQQFAPGSGSGLTVSIWVNIEASTTDQGCPVAKLDSALNGPTWQLYIEDSTDALVSGYSAADQPWTVSLQGITALESGWHMLSLTWDGATATAWFDGSAQGSTQVDLGFDDSPIVIGAEPTNGNVICAYDGLAAELFVYDRPLQAGELATLHAAPDGS